MGSAVTTELAFHGRYRVVNQPLFNLLINMINTYLEKKKKDEIDREQNYTLHH